MKTEESLKNYYVAKYLKEVGIFNKEDLDSDYPVKPFQKSHLQRSNVSNRIDRLEEGINKIQDTVNQLADQFQRKAYVRKCEICWKMCYSKESYLNRLIAQSNFTRSYFTPLKPIVSQCTHPDSDGDDNNSGDYDEENNKWYDMLVKKNRHQ